MTWTPPRVGRACAALACAAIVALGAAPPASPPASPPPDAKPDAKSDAKPAGTAPADGSAEASAAPAKYMRVVEGADGTMTMEIASRAFRRADGTGPTVYLVGAMHIADRSFYEAKQTELDACDVVLFEGVKASGMEAIDASLDDAAKAEATRKRLAFLGQLAVAARQRSGAFAKDLEGLEADAGRFRSAVHALRDDGWGHPLVLTLVDVPARPATDAAPAQSATQRVRLVSLGSDGAVGGEGAAADLVHETESIAPDAAAKKAGGNIQQMLAKTLGVSFQLDHIDSGKPNWRNSDIGMDELRTLLDEAGPEAGRILRMLDGNSFEAKFAGVLLSLVGMSSTLTTVVKVMLVDTLANADELAASLPGMDKGMEAMQRVIIEDRNRIVLDDLRRIIADEPQRTTIAVFYGAGHMASMERCMTAELGLAPQGETWTAALRVDPREAGLTKAQVKQMRDMVGSTLKRQAGRR